MPAGKLMMINVNMLSFCTVLPKPAYTSQFQLLDEIIRAMFAFNN